MPASFIPRLDILPAPQLALWPELAQVPREFVLYGGTAIALHLGHRESVDFDFFGDRSLEPGSLTLAIPFLNGAVVTHRAPDTLSCTVERGGPVKMSFFGLPEIARLRPPHVAPGNGLQIASLLDLAGTKAAVVQQRAEAKDYIDIDAILVDGRITLLQALAAARAIYGKPFNSQITLKALCYFDDGGLHSLPAALKKRLVQAVAAVELDQLPALAASLAPKGPHP